MWLPQDEQRLLRHYHQARDQVGKERDYSLEHLVVVVYCKNRKEASDHIEREGQKPSLENMPENAHRYVDQYNKVRSANESLRQLKLVTLTPQKDPNLIRLGLTAQGDDLGRKYGSWWMWSNLWYTEYIKNHWICVIVSFLVGVVGTLLVNWLTRGASGE